MSHSLEDTLSLLRHICRPLPEERVPLNDALGRVLREPLCAGEDLPSFDRSAMDGYAVRADETARELTVVDEIRAGDWKPRVLEPGQAVRIATGAALPADNLRVVPQEDTTRAGQFIQLHQVPADGWIRRQGEDARRGERLVPTGTRLSPGHLVLGAALGQTQLSVTRLPQIVHVTTGNELVAPDQTPARGQIRDSNTIQVRAFLAQMGFPVCQRSAGEDWSSLRRAVARIDAESVDLLLVSGGSSVGDHDSTAPMLQEMGYSIHVRKTNVRPGRPLIVASRDGRIALGLPGNPVSHFVCCHLYVSTVLRLLSGMPGGPDFLVARLFHPLDQEPHSRESILPARLAWAQDRLMVEPIAWRSSGDAVALARVEALARVPPGIGALPSGAEVNVLPVSSGVPGLTRAPV